MVDTVESESRGELIGELFTDREMYTGEEGSTEKYDERESEEREEPMEVKEDDDRMLEALKFIMLVLTR